MEDKRNQISFQVYGGLSDYLSRLSRYYTCDDSCPTPTQLQLRYLDRKEQAEFLIPLVKSIKEESNSTDEQAKIAISLVQRIPYDWESFTTNNLNDRYPYEVLYDKAGVCGEKSRLLAFLLRELGYGVALFDFSSEQHMAVGIKCPLKYSYDNTGYCFVETARPTIITDSENDYVGVGQLKTKPKIYIISDGFSLEDVEEEYNDANTLNKLEREYPGGGTVPYSVYYIWKELDEKYGLLDD